MKFRVYERRRCTESGMRKMGIMFEAHAAKTADTVEMNLIEFRGLYKSRPVEQNVAGEQSSGEVAGALECRA